MKIKCFFKNPLVTFTEQCSRKDVGPHQIGETVRSRSYPLTCVVERWVTRGHVPLFQRKTDVAE